MSIFRRSHGSQNLIITLSTFRYLLRFSTVATQINPSKKKPSLFIIDYLKNSLGFTVEEAITASKKLAYIKSTENPSLVLRFFRENGLKETQIRYLVSSTPGLLSYDVENTLKPKIRVFQDLGLSGSDLADVMVGDPCLFMRGLNTHIIPSIKFLENLLGSKENVIKAIKKSKWLISCNAHKRVQPNILVLQNYGISDEGIKKFLLRNPRCFLNRPDWLEKVIGRVESEFGISRESGMFMYAIDAVGSLSESKWESKYQIFKSFGWSEYDIVSMIRNLPLCLNISEEKIHRGLNFWMKELGYKPDYIAFHPKILMYSLDKRIKPRHLVLNMFKERGLIRKGPSLYSLLCLEEPKFFKDFVLKYNDKAPDVYEAYIKSVHSTQQDDLEYGNLFSVVGISRFTIT